jgi:hypothetical protein
MSERISAPLCRPWHLMPQKTVSARRMSMKKKLKSCGYLSVVRTPASANPLLAHRRGVSGSPTYGRKIQVRARLIKPRGCQPTPIPAPALTLSQAKARVTSKGTVSRMM